MCSSYISHLFVYIVFLLSDALRITPPHLRVREGRPATLICRTNDRSIPTGGITWNGPHGRTYGPASSPIGDRVRAANHFLYITNANRSDHGSYRCTSVVTGTQSPATVVEVTSMCVCVCVCVLVIPLLGGSLLHTSWCWMCASKCKTTHPQVTI